MSFIEERYAEQTKMIMDIIMRGNENPEELDLFINESIKENLKRTPCELRNNYSGKCSKTDMVKLLDWYNKKNPIPCEHGVFFKRHDEANNLNAAFVNSFLVQRKADKKMMFKCEQEGDLEGVRYYNTRQKVQKIFANSYYGVQGQRSSVFYNLYTALSVTGKGQSIISCAATTFEQFLCNNIKFKSIDDCLLFIARVCNEERTFKDEDVLDKDITKKELINYLARLFEDKMECMSNQDVLKQMIINLTQEEVNRVYYKNNLYAFLANQYCIDLIEKCIQECDEFKNPNEIPETIQEYMSSLWDLLKEFVLYNYPVYDRVNWLKTEQRKCVITVDTDSNFLNLEPFYEFTVDHVSFEIKPEDWETTYKIVNIISAILGKVIAEAYWTFTTNCNVPEEKRPIINMKNEFLMSRIILTNNKKNYASYVLLQEGVQIPDKKALDIKGLPIKKSNVNKNTGQYLMDLLKYDILHKDTIDIQTKALLQKLTILEDNIRESLTNGDITYMSPGKVNEIESYKAPYTIASVRASLAWNAVYPENPVVYPAQINMVKCNIETLEDIVPLYETHPDIYRALKEQIFEDENLGKYGVTYFGMPKAELKIPEWIIPYIDIDTIIRDNIKNFLVILESIGLKTVSTNADTMFFSNIISF